MITGKLYNQLKFLAQVALPAAGTLYVTLAGLWGLPSPQEVAGTILALCTFLGVVLQISSSNYNSSTAQGTLGIHETEEGKLFRLELEGDPEVDLEGKDRVVFKVRKSSEVVPSTPASAKKTATRRRRTADS
jgi:ABC-type branched-subunit amino acid transport system permease subunit